MKKIVFIEDTMANKISFWHLACFLVLLPFDFFYSEIVLISFAIHTMIHCKKERLRLLFTKPVLILVILYFLGLITILYSRDKSEGFNVTGRQTALFLIPLLFVVNGLDLEKYKLLLLKIFAFTCVVTVLYLYVDAIRVITYFHLPASSLFSNMFINHNFSAPIELHATYMSMYVALSIFVLLYNLIQQSSFKRRLFYVISILVLAAGLVQLSSRAVVIALLIIINVAFPFFMLKGKRRIFFIIITTLFSAVSIFLVTKVNSFKVRYIGELKNDLTQVSVNNEILEPRIARWKLAMQLVKKSPIIGHGNGSEKRMLKQLYFENKLYISYLNEFNAHNQYLSFLLKTGIIGLLIYLYVLFFGFSLAVRKKDFIFLGFMIIVALVSISENILDVNKGIFFYSFFMSLFVLANLSEMFYKRQPVPALSRFNIKGIYLKEEADERIISSDHNI